MTLEDFFTMTEMNNGLTSPSQVRELISVMQKERDCIVKNEADRTRQRSTVARAIAATENEECLDLFIQLDGLHFVSNWLKEAQTLSNDSNSSVEESIIHLLRALEKLHLDYEKSIVFGIRTTVEILVNHKSSEVQDRARVLLESWKLKKDSIDMPLSDVDKSRDLTDEEQETRETSVKDNGHELTRDDQVVSKSLDAVCPEQVESAHEIENHVSSSPSVPKPTSPPSSRQDFLDTDSDFHALKPKTSEGRPLTSSSDAVAEMEDVAEQNSNNSFSAGSKTSSDEDLSDSDSDGKSGSGGNSSGSPNAITPKDGEKSWGKYLSGIKDYSSDEIDGMVDPLEVAMQVAMEVEREHVDYSQHSSSNSPKILPSSPVSVKHSPANEGSPMDSATSTKNPNPQENAVPQITEAVQDEPNTEKIACNFFDLNQEVLMEDSDPHDHHHDHDHETKLSAPVSVVSASRASAADPKLPSSPLQFEGNLGWKGSALTSAFRRVPETDSKQQKGWCLDFDLNVTECVDDSNVETDSNRSDHLELDLNRMSGDGGSHLNNWSQFPQPVGNIGGPSFLSAKKAPSQNLNIRSNGDSAISIMGTRVEVNRKDFTSELGFDINSGRTGNNFTVPYVHSSGYNFAPGPTVPFTGPVYGPARPIPYMVDSRGMAVMSGLSQQPFVMNMNGPRPCNGVGQSRGSVDLNSGMWVEGGSRDPNGLGLLLNSAQVRPMGEVSSVGGKRKEADSGYNEFNYYPSKHYTPSHWRQN